VWHQFVITHPQRDALSEYLLEKGVETMIHYPIPPHQQACFIEQTWPELNITEQLSRSIVSLPIYPGLSGDAIRYVADVIRAFDS
jgi:dTDP-4-amino-4,6-dideoxygalactose transaminase